MLFRSCRVEVDNCRDGRPQTCVPAAPQAETCNGLDDDCDGVVDNDVPVGRLCDTGRPGICAPGHVRCVSPNSTCVSDRLPEAERCDGIDNDCDGVVDDGVAGTGGACVKGVGACATEGVVTCDSATGAVACEADLPAPGVERCNDLDDDCDGATDEDFVLGVSCTVGQGDCQVAGVTRCTDDGAGVTCGATPAAPGVELCDGRDNDCNGQVDDGLDLGAPCTVGVGACAQTGQRVCAPDGTVTCTASPLAPELERCNGVATALSGDAEGRIADALVGLHLLEAESEYGGQNRAPLLSPRLHPHRVFEVARRVDASELLFQQGHTKTWVNLLGFAAAAHAFTQDGD